IVRRSEISSGGVEVLWRFVYGRNCRSPARFTENRGAGLEARETLVVAGSEGEGSRMTDERRRQVEEIVSVVLGLPAAERAARLDSACGPDPELRRAVESLLEQEALAHAFLETPALEAVALALAREKSPAPAGSPTPDDAITGQVISHYRILEKVG